MITIGYPSSSLYYSLFSLAVLTNNQFHVTQFSLSSEAQ